MPVKKMLLLFEVIFIFEFVIFVVVFIFYVIIIFEGAFFVLVLVR